MRGRAESLFRKRRMPGQGIAVGNQNVGMAIAVQINETQVRLIPGNVGQARELS